MGVEQLALSVQLPDDETFESFHELDNYGAVEQLKSFISSSSSLSTEPNSFYLFGVSGVGKSHLLHACCSYASECELTSVCLSFSDIAELSVEIFDGLEHMDLVCLDNLALIAGDSEWEKGIFDLFNRLIENNKKIIITAHDSATLLNILLPDLVSRLNWGFTEQIKDMNDEDKLIVIQHRALQRGLILHDDAAKFLMNRLSRNLKDLIVSLDILDKASIKEQRKITIPFIKSVLLTQSH